MGVGEVGSEDRGGARSFFIGTSVLVSSYIYKY